MAKKKIENKNRKNSSKKHPGATTRKGSNDKAGHKGSNDKATHHNLDVFKPAYFHLAVGIVLSVLCCYALKAFAKGEANAGAVAGNMMKDVQVINTTSVHRLEQTNSSSLHNERIDETCKFYLAKSTIENSGNGIYTTEPIAAGQKIGLEDLVIQLPDITPQYAASMRLLLFNYAWDGSKFGGQYEGQRVYSLVPGVGALANGHQTMCNTDVGGPGPVMDHAGLTRHQSPGAGAVTHYHKYSFVAMDDIVAGGEILMNYGVNWFKERERKGIMKSPDTLQEKARSTDWLRENGICLDHIKVGPSTKEHAGRGAFSQRRFQKGALVVATPILQILDRRAMVMKRMKGGVEEVTEQLILNYCYGHRDSSLLFFPYAPFVNFINHDFQYPNVELRWSRSSQHSIQIQNMSLADLKQLQNTGLVLDLVALRDIEEGEELFLNYGEAWDEAWDAHVRDWYDEETSAERQVSYAHDLDEKYEILYTQEEQKRDPVKRYPDNIFTSCYYSYKDGIRSNRKHGNLHLWTMTKDAFDMKNLRPCIVLDRHERNANSNSNQNLFYTVGIMNRFGLNEDERIPKGKDHIVTGVPRNALRFSSKLYTTDQHMPTAFRHFIDLGDDIFPQQWREIQ